RRLLGRARLAPGLDKGLAHGRSPSGALRDGCRLESGQIVDGQGLLPGLLRDAFQSTLGDTALQQVGQGLFVHRNWHGKRLRACASQEKSAERNREDNLDHRCTSQTILRSSWGSFGRD